MSDKETWKQTGTGLGHAFRDLGKTLINTGKKGVDHAVDWAGGDGQPQEELPQQGQASEQSPYDPRKAQYVQPPANQPTTTPTGKQDMNQPAPYIPQAPPAQPAAQPAAQPVVEQGGKFQNKAQVLTLPNNPNETFAALKRAIDRIGNCKITGVDENNRSLLVNTGVSAFSWGERVTVNVMQGSNGGSAVEVISAPKTGAAGNIGDMGKNNRNIAAIFNALQAELGASRQAPAQPAAQPAVDPSMLVADEIKKLAALRDQGILTDEEFTEQKRRLLGF